MADRMKVKKGARPALLAVTIALAVGGWLVTRPDESTVFVPFLPEASVVVADAAIDAAPPPEVQPILIALIGQSNSIGRADEDALSVSSFSSPFAPVQVKQQNAATPTDPLVWTSYANGDLQPRSDHATQNMGPELSMGRYLDRAAPNKIDIVKIGIGGSGLNDHWNPTSLYPAIGGDPNLFTQAVQFIQAAEDDFDRPLSAIVWVQGESDALDGADAAAYEANLTALITAFRVVWPDVPFIFNRLNSSHAYTHLATVRAAQAAVDSAVAHTRMVDSDGLPLQIDGDHYTADGYITLGNRLAVALLAELGINVPPVALWSSVADDREITFTDASTDDDGTIVSWLWNFGDSTTSTQQNPVHTYAANGVYTVTLTVTDNSGATHQFTNSVSAILPVWAIDATSGKGVPVNATEWGALIADNALTNWSAPNSLFLCQESSGNLADSIGSITLTANASPLYQQTVSGWTRKAVGTTDATANQRFRSTETGLPDLDSTSMLVLAYVAVTNNPGAARGVMGIGNPSGIERRAASGITSSLGRATAGSTVTSSTEGGFAVRPLIIKINRGANEARYYSDIEKLSPTFGTPDGKLIDLGATIGASPATNRYLYVAFWTGSAAERSDQDVRDLLEALGWTVSGYGSPRRRRPVRRCDRVRRASYLRHRRTKNTTAHSVRMPSKIATTTSGSMGGASSTTRGSRSNIGTADNATKSQPATKTAELATA